MKRVLEIGFDVGYGFEALVCGLHFILCLLAVVIYKGVFKVV